MADDKTKVGKPDRDRIAIHWEQHFGESRERIREAVKAVGPIVKDVEKWLKGHPASK